MTRVQRAWLESIGAAGEVEAVLMPDVTRRAMKNQYMIEDCSRMYFGPRSHRVRLTGLGKQELDKQRRRAAEQSGTGEKP